MGNVTAMEIAKHLYKEGMQCNCDLDKWQPEMSTGHSWVCRIHKAAMRPSDELIQLVESKGVV